VAGQTPIDRPSRIPTAFATLQELLDLSQDCLEHRKYAQAVASAQMAALFAAYNHPGQFGSARLERILRRIGTDAIPPNSGSTARRSCKVERVLHVLTAAKDIGGDSRFVWRWIQRDTGRRHSIALTEQLYFKVPGQFTDGVSARGGSIHVLDTAGAEPLERARALRRLASDADVVFLHVYVEDVIPVIAFASRAGLPPIVFVVQADHQFWTGLSVCDLFVHLRESGKRLSQARRGIDASRIATLPIPLEPSSAAGVGKSAAKRALGCPEDTVLLLSIARAIKYQPIDGTVPSFPSALAPMINRHPNAMLLVVGPGQTGDWEEAARTTGGRIRALGQHSDTARLYEAADVYLDSFPFASNTSLLEAASYGVPLLTYFPYSEEAAVLGAGAPGLDSCLLRAESLEAYAAILTSLITDREARARNGRIARENIASVHMGAGWIQSLEALYRDVQMAALDTPVEIPQDGPHEGQLDCLLHSYNSPHFPLGWIVDWYARRLPYWCRVQLLIRILAITRSFAFSLFLPRSVQARVGGRLGSWRRLPAVSRWLSART
jgi:glycosyltransferase involved in cell wall biosynthesis